MGIPSYAERMEHVSGSAVREILKLTQQPDMISWFAVSRFISHGGFEGDYK